MPTIKFDNCNQNLLVLTFWCIGPVKCVSHICPWQYGVGWSYYMNLNTAKFTVFFNCIEKIVLLLKKSNIEKIIYWPQFSLFFLCDIFFYCFSLTIWVNKIHKYHIENFCLYFSSNLRLFIDDIFEKLKEVFLKERRKEKKITASSDLNLHRVDLLQVRNHSIC